MPEALSDGRILTDKRRNELDLASTSISVNGIWTIQIFVSLARLGNVGYMLLLASTFIALHVWLRQVGQRKTLKNQARLLTEMEPEFRAKYPLPLEGMCPVSCGRGRRTLTSDKTLVWDVGYIEVRGGIRYYGDAVETFIQASAIESLRVRGYSKPALCVRYRERKGDEPESMTIRLRDGSPPIEQYMKLHALRARIVLDPSGQSFPTAAHESVFNRTQGALERA